jgi:hypothetical protein
LQYGGEWQQWRAIGQSHAVEQDTGVGFIASVFQLRCCGTVLFHLVLLDAAPIGVLYAMPQTHPLRKQDERDQQCGEAQAASRCGR